MTGQKTKKSQKKINGRDIEKLVRVAVREFGNIKEEIDLIKEKDPAAKSSLEVALLYSGFHALVAYRISHALYERKHFFSARAISQAAKFLTGVEIHPGAKIGKGLFIDHGNAVVIGETTEIGDNCTIYQGATLGGTGKDKGKRHPTLGNNVMVGCGAKVLGPFTVGDNAKIAANAVVLKEVPAGMTAVGIPAKTINTGVAKRENDNMDHIHIPDPTSQELCRLRQQIERLEKKLEALEKGTE
ncbi:MAG: serine O-acetyltransferase [Ruminococcaceae bacterium]|nr:serine O-acetyltransferase [Oscillospiraceae bacterium]